MKIREELRKLFPHEIRQQKNVNPIRNFLPGLS